MKIQLNDDGIIIGYAIVGDIENSVEVSDNQLPENFKQKFVRGYYKLDDNGAVVVNENYKAPTEETYQDTTQPSNNNTSIDLTSQKELQRMIAMLSSIQKTSVKNAIVSEKLMKQNADLTKEVTQLKQQSKGGE